MFPLTVCAVAAQIALAISTSHRSNRASIESSLLPATNLPKGWSSTGCFGDNVSARSLQSAFFYSSNMTGEACIGLCQSQGFPVAGTEWSRECFCDTDTSTLKGYPGECNMPCTGDPDQACGGPVRLSVYTAAGKIPVTGADEEPLTRYMGCWTDPTSNRILPRFTSLPEGAEDMTVTKCTNLCRKGGYDHAGVEYAKECWCGMSVNTAQQWGTPRETGCNMPCRGNFSEYCGGPNRINIYYLPPLNGGKVKPRQIIVNGGFENKATVRRDWNITTNPLNPDGGSLAARVGHASGYAVNGTRVATINEAVDEFQKKRSLCISQSAYHPGAGMYNISTYIGRILGLDTIDATGQPISPDKLSFQLLVDDKEVKSGNVCDPTRNDCTIMAKNGALAYTLEQQQVELIESQIGFHTLSICVTFEGYVPTDPFVFLVDDVSSIGPY